MGLNAGSKRTFLRIKNGKFYKHEDKEFTTPYGSLEGRLKDISFKNVKFESGDAEMATVVMESEGEVFQFDINSSGRQFSTFMNSLLNKDATKDIVVAPKQSKNDKGKDVPSIMVGQDDNWKSKYTKDNPGDLPPLKQVKFKGQESWDNTDQLEFYKERIVEILSLIKNSPEEKEDVPNTTDEGNFEEDDSLPF